jgi:hypothetical protein
MIIGSANALRLIATQLNANLAGSDDIETRDWPREIARINIGTPEDAYPVSFHLETQRGKPASNVPRSAAAFWVLLGMLPFALIGLLTVAGWIKRAL